MKLTGLKTAVGEYQRFNRGGKFGAIYGRLMFDESDGHLWCAMFCDLGHDSWIDYHDSDVHEIGRDIEYRYGKVNMANVRDYIEHEYYKDLG